MYPTGLIPRKKDEVDKRDLKYSTLFKVSRKADRVILDPREVKDQKGWGTCGSFAVGSVIDRFYRKRMSEIYNYTKTKESDAYPDQEGTTIIDVVKTHKKFGTVSNELFPYELYKEKMVFPIISPSIDEEAKKNRIDAYVKITTPEELTDHLLHGEAAVGGFIVGLTSLFNPEHLPNGDAIIGMPDGTMAGHALKILGVDWNMSHTYKTGFDKGKTRKGFIKIVNSWGTEDRIDEFTGETRPAWSKTGEGFIPFDYVFGQMYAPDGSMMDYVNEIFVPLKNVPFEIHKIDKGNENITPYIKDSRTLVPLRFIGEILGLQVEFKESDRSISITGEGRSVSLTIGSKVMIVNGKQVTIDVAPEIKDSRTFVPLRAISEAFGAEVQYFENEQRVEIRKDDLIIEMWIGINEARRIKRL